MIMKLSILILLLTAASLSLTAGAQEPGCQLVLNNALTYLGKPYVAHTLEINDEEQLVVNLEEVDCTTFVEYVLAQSLATVRSGAMEDYLKRIRYRDGRIDGYTSRLHYIAEWVENGVQNGFIKDITAMNSTDTVPLKLSFMSTHPNAYRHLKDSPENVKKIKDVERKLSVGSFHYLPKEKISDEGLPWIKDGDIFCITTNITGLDVVHLGFACYRDGQLKLLHASSSSKQVVLSEGSFAQMFRHNKNWTGVRVLRMIQ